MRLEAQGKGLEGILSLLETGIVNVSGADDRIQTRVGKGGVRKLTRSTGNALGQLSSKEKEKYREVVGKGDEVSWHVKGCGV